MRLKCSSKTSNINRQDREMSIPMSLFPHKKVEKMNRKALKILAKKGY